MLEIKNLRFALIVAFPRYYHPCSTFSLILHGCESAFVFEFKIAGSVNSLFTYWSRDEGKMGHSGFNPSYIFTRAVLDASEFTCICSGRHYSLTLLEVVAHFRSGSLIFFLNIFVKSPVKTVPMF